MLIRVAVISDIESIQFVRNAVKENRLSNPMLVPDKDVAHYITERGKGWVCELDEQIVGFAIADLKEQNIWALFVLPDYEGNGIGKALHNEMLDWYFNQQEPYVWLGTAPQTRAERFYRLQGWKENGKHGDKEIKFEMDEQTWRRLHPGK